MLCGVAVLLLCGSVARAEVMTPTTFTERFAQALGAAVPAAKVAIRQDLQLTVGRADGKINDINLHKIYDEYRGQPSRFDELVELFARAVREPVPATLQASRIVPTIKDRGWLAGIASLSKSPGHEPLSEPLNEELVIAYVEDSSTRARYLTASDEVGDRKTLRARAVANLKRILPKIEMRPQPDGWAIVSAGGNYEASLLLLDEIWSSRQIKVDGDIVVAIPARDALLVTGSNNRSGLKALRAMADRLASEPYRLTKRLFVYREGRFAAFEPN